MHGKDASRVRQFRDWVFAGLFLMFTVVNNVACIPEDKITGSGLTDSGSTSVGRSPLDQLDGVWNLPCKVGKEGAGGNAGTEPGELSLGTSFSISRGKITVIKTAYSNFKECRNEPVWEERSEAIISYERPSSTLDGVSNMTILYNKFTLTPKSQDGVEILIAADESLEGGPVREWKKGVSVVVGTGKDEKPGLDIFQVKGNKLCFGAQESPPNPSKRPTQLEPLNECAIKVRAEAQQ
jgi:hypothetical protein